MCKMVLDLISSGIRYFRVMHEHFHVQVTTKLWVFRHGMRPFAFKPSPLFLCGDKPRKQNDPGVLTSAVIEVEYWIMLHGEYLPPAPRSRVRKLS